MASGATRSFLSGTRADRTWTMRSHRALGQRSKRGREHLNAKIQLRDVRDGLAHDVFSQEILDSWSDRAEGRPPASLRGRCHFLPHRPKPPPHDRTTT